MNTIHLADAAVNFSGIAAKVIADAQPTIVEISSSESVVVMPLDEFTSWQETAYLLNNPVNAEHLRKSIREAKTGSYIEQELDES